MKLQGVMIGSENPKALGEFYTKVCGKTVWQQDDWYGYDINGGFLMVGPHSEVKGKSKEPQRIMISFICDDVKAEFDRVKGQGATVIAEPYQPDPKGSPDMWLATLADLDGNYLQISLPWKE
jgi:predicted enzyme related to lactoylglutathione lyase